MTTNDDAAHSLWFDRSAAVRLRSDLAVMHVAGEDARTWLNGQISNDVRQTTAGDAVYALVLNVRGKILADLWALDRGDTFTLLVPRDALTALIAHLEQYVIMEDVTLTPAADLAVLSIQGPRSRDVIGDKATSVFPCDELGVGGFHVLAPEAEAGTLLETLSQNARAVGGGAVGDAVYEIARVRHGVPRFGRDFDLQHYPQEAGLKQRAVSFSKGCYLGQEVVCTLESRGKLSRRLVALTANGVAPAAGDVLLTASGDETGLITSVVSARGDIHALGYVRRIHIDPHAPLLTNRSVTLSIARVIGEA